jgi:hypothetical protein
MLILSAPTDLIEVVLGGAMATAEPRIVASWRDITTTAFTPGRTVGTTNGATPVSAAGSPAADTQRVIDFLNIYNLDTAPVTVTVRYDSGTEYVMWSGSLGVGESLQYVDGIGWQRLTATGLVATGITTADSVVAGRQTLVGPGAVNITQMTTEFESTGVLDALTLANGTPGFIKTIIHKVDGGSGLLTPTLGLGFTTITFTNVGESAVLEWSSVGWVILSLRGAVAA